LRHNNDETFQNLVQEKQSKGKQKFKLKGNPNYLKSTRRKIFNKSLQVNLTQIKVGNHIKIIRSLSHKGFKLILKQCDNRQKLGEIRTTETHANSDNLFTNKVQINFIPLYNNGDNQNNTIEHLFKTVEMIKFILNFKESKWFKIRFKKWKFSEAQIIIEGKFKFKRRLKFDKGRFKLKMEIPENISNSFDEFLSEARDVMDTAILLTTLRANKKVNKTGLVDDDKFTIVNEKHEQEIFWSTVIPDKKLTYRATRFIGARAFSNSNTTEGSLLQQTLQTLHQKIVIHWKI
jgi:hypothetical protein